MSHPSPEELKTHARECLPYRSTGSIALHLLECGPCQSALDEIRELLLIEAELNPSAP
jgi:hypothetical protein